MKENFNRWKENQSYYDIIEFKKLKNPEKYIDIDENNSIITYKNSETHTNIQYVDKIVNAFKTLNFTLKANIDKSKELIIFEENTKNETLYTSLLSTDINLDSLKYITYMLTNIAIIGKSFFDGQFNNEFNMLYSKFCEFMTGEQVQTFTQFGNSFETVHGQVKFNDNRINEFEKSIVGFMKNFNELKNSFLNRIIYMLNLKISVIDNLLYDLHSINDKSNTKYIENFIEIENKLNSLKSVTFDMGIRIKKYFSEILHSILRELSYIYIYKNINIKVKAILNRTNTEKIPPKTTNPGTNSGTNQNLKTNLANLRNSLFYIAWMQGEQGNVDIQRAKLFFDRLLFKKTKTTQNINPNFIYYTLRESFALPLDNLKYTNDLEVNVSLKIARNAFIETYDELLNTLDVNEISVNINSFSKDIKKLKMMEQKRKFLEAKLQCSNPPLKGGELKKNINSYISYNGFINTYIISIVMLLYMCKLMKYKYVTKVSNTHYTPLFIDLLVTIILYLILYPIDPLFAQLFFIDSLMNIYCTIFTNNTNCYLYPYALIFIFNIS